MRWKYKLLLQFVWTTLLLCPDINFTLGKVYLDDKTNGYTGVVVGVTDNAADDATHAQQLISNIKELMGNASQMLYETTGNRLYFHHVTILVPYSWRTYDDIEFNDLSKNELFHFAPIHVGPMNPDHGDSPYTLQRGDCSEGGDYIHLTPNYLSTINNSTTKYDNPVKVFIGEWARYRFGVFTENNPDVFYYDPEEARFMPTYCANEVANGHLINPATKTQCVTDELGMPLEYCRFEIDQKNNDHLISSLLFKTNLPNVVEFCDKTNHNKYSPTLQNRRCKGKSVWEVMKQHHDFSSTRRAKINSTEPEFHIVTAHLYPSMVLAIDTAANNNKPLANTIIASISKYILFAVPDNTTMEILAVQGAISNVVTKIQIQEMKDRWNLIHAVESTLNIIPTLANPESGLLTESHHTDWSSGCVIYIIASAEATGNWSRIKGARFLPIFLNVNPIRNLTDLAENTDGNSYAFFGNAWQLEEDLGSALFDSSHYWDGDQLIQLSSTIVKQSQELPVNFLVDSAVLGHVRIVVSADTSNGTFDEELLLISPDRFYGVSNAIPFPEIEREMLTFNLENGKAGLWSLRLTNYSSQLNNLLVVKVFAVITQCTSAVTSAAQINKKLVQAYNNDIPVPRLTITVKKDGGFEKPASITATLFPPYTENEAATVTKYPRDDGSGADVIARDGVYSTFINHIIADGIYKIVPRVYGGNSLDCLTGKTSDCFQRIPCPLYFQVIGYSSEKGSDNILPGNITDFVGRVKLNTYDDTVVTLFWTAPGDDSSDGIVFGYDLQFFETYENAITFTGGRNVTDRMIIGGSLDPVPSGENQTITVWFSSNLYGYLTTGYLAVRAYDEDGNQASGSNIVIIPLTPTDVSPPVTDYTTFVNVTTTEIPLHWHAYDGVISSIVLLAFAILLAGGIFIQQRIAKSKEKKRPKHQDYIIGIPISATVV